MGKRIHVSNNKPHGLQAAVLVISLSCIALAAFKIGSARGLARWLPERKGEDIVVNTTVTESPSVRITSAAEDQMLRNADEQERWRLTHAMMYWTHSHPVPRPSPEPLFPSRGSRESGYITWEQDFAGLNNVRLQVEVLIMLAACLQRTLVMPDHLAGAMDHQHATPTPFSAFFDFKDLSRWIHIISMDQYLTDRGIPSDDAMRHDGARLREYLRGSDHNSTILPKWDANGDVLVVPSAQAASRRTSPSLQEFLKGRGKETALEYTTEMQQARTLHFQTGDGYRLFGHVAGFIYFPSQAWQDFYYAQLRDHFHYRRDLIYNASVVVHSLKKRYKTTTFNAVHDRMGDFKGQFPSFIVSDQSLSDNLLLCLGKAATGVPLYISSQYVNDTRFAPIMAAFPHAFYGSQLIEELLPGLPPVLQAPIEQLVCSVASRFVGTFGSTFTALVHRLRGHHQSDLVPDKDMYFINRPDDPEQYRRFAENATEQTHAAWWPQPEGWPIVSEGTWTREWFWTWQFHKSQVQRDSIVFEPVR